MKLSRILEQELKTPNIPILSLVNLNNNIDDYLKYERDLSDEQRAVFIQTIIRVMQSLSRKLPPDNKYESFIRRLYDKDKVNDNLKKIKKYNKKILSLKQREGE